MQERQNPVAYLTPQNDEEKNNEDKDNKRDEKDKDDKEGKKKKLTDLSESNWYSKIFESLADFFVHARH